MNDQASVANHGGFGLSGAATSELPAFERQLTKILVLTIPLSILLFFGAPVSGYDRFAAIKEAILHSSALCVAIVAWAHRRPGRVTLDGLQLALLVSLVCGFLSMALVAQNRWWAAREWSMALSAVILWRTARYVSQRGQHEKLLVVIELSLAALALVVLLEAQGFVPKISMQGRGPGGTAGNRNYMANLVIMALPLAAHHLRHCAERWSVILHSLSLILVGAATTLSRSRGAWVAGAFSLLLVAVGPIVIRLFHGASVKPTPVVRAGATGSGTSRARFGMLVPIVMVLVGVVVGVISTRRADWTERSPYRDTVVRLLDVEAGTGHGRLIQYRNTARMALHHPLLGVGPLNWSIRYPEYASKDDPSLDPSLIQPSNRLPSHDLLGIMAQWGLVAAAAIVVFAFLVLRTAIRRLRHRPDAAGLVYALLAVLSALVVSGLTNTNLLRAEPAILAALMTGILAAGTPSSPTVTLPARPMIGAVALLVAAASVLNAGLLISTYRRRSLLLSSKVSAARFDPGNFALRLEIAAFLERTERCALAIEFAREALNLYPQSTVGRRVLADCRNAKAQNGGSAESK